MIASHIDQREVKVVAVVHKRILPASGEVGIECRVDLEIRFDGGIWRSVKNGPKPVVRVDGRTVRILSGTNVLASTETNTEREAHEIFATLEFLL